MTFQELQRGSRQSARDQALDPDDNRVLSFAQWCALNGISFATGRRLINAGKGPSIIQLSPRRIGITVRDNRLWQASRMRK